MQLTEDLKTKIKNEYIAWKESLLKSESSTNNNSKQIDDYPEIVFKALETFDLNKHKKVFDTCLGEGNLIAAKIIAGADPKKCYGIEIDPEIIKLAKQRLSKLGVPEENIRLGNLLDYGL